MGDPIENDPFDLSRLGVQAQHIPDRLIVRCTDRPRLQGGGELPHAGIQSLWELGAAVGTSSRSLDQQFLRLSSRTPLLNICRPPKIPFPSIAGRRMKGSKGTLIGPDWEADDALRLFEALKVHGDLLRDVFERGGEDPRFVRAQNADWCPLRSIFSKLWVKSPEHSPPEAMIVRIEKRLREPLENLERELRTQLRRRRALVPVGRVDEIDAGCVRWLAMQPGKSLAERAGPRQEVLSVVREPNVDTFENRILKACLLLSEREARLYLHSYEAEFFSTPRVLRVRGLLRRVKGMLEDEAFQSIGRPSDDQRPNYVLQYHRDYSHVWWAYEQLRAHRRAETELWRWRHRFWGEIVLFDLFWAATQAECSDDVTSDRELGILHDPQRGYWLHWRSRFPTFHIRRNNEIFRIEISAPMLTNPPLAEPCRRLFDISVQVRSSTRGSEVSTAEIQAFARYIPATAHDSEWPTRHIVRPLSKARNEESALEQLRNGPGLPAVLAWPTGRNSLECASAFLDRLVDKASRTGGRQ